MTTHTPGPWIATTTRNGTFVVRNSRGELVCMFDWRQTTQRQRDARLVAAAPELLDALQAIIGHEAHLLNPYRVEAARAAIAKATGA